MDGYWQVLYDSFLRSHRNSNLLKLCVHILRQSIPNINTDVATGYMRFSVTQRTAYISAFNKYCFFFENLVIGRYINQIEECLLQFPAFSGYMEPENKALLLTGGNEREDMTLVPAVWWTLLFTAGLQNQNSDIIRKTIGEYLFRNYHEESRVSTFDSLRAHTFKTFLFDSLLPWAVQGHLLNKRLVRTDNEALSHHGDELAAFCTTVASCCSELSLPCIEITLQFLSDPKTKKNGHAAAYILQGFSFSKRWVPDLDIAEQVVQLPDKIPLSHRQRAIIFHQCLAISQRYEPDQKIDEEERQPSSRLLQFLRRQQSLADVAGIELRPSLRLPRDDDFIPSAEFIFDASTLSLDEFEAQTRETTGSIYTPCSHRPGFCLHGEALLSACEYVLQVFDQAPSGIDNALGLTVLHRIWFEFERQEHPSTFASLIPQVILHPTIVAASTTSPDLSAAITEYTHVLDNICRGNTYFWKPLAEAIRKAYTTTPGTLQLLSLENMIMAFINDPPKRKEEFFLDAALASRERTLFNHNLDIYADESNGHACVFDILNHLRPTDREFAFTSAEKIIEPWLKQKEPISVVSAWKKTSQLQALLILYEYSTSETEGTEKIFLRILTILQILAIEPLPRYRFLMEWMILSAAMKLPHDVAIVESLLTMLEHADHANPKLVSSLIKMNTQLIMHPDRAIVPPGAPSGVSYGGSSHEWSPSLKAQIASRIKSIIPKAEPPSLLYDSLATIHNLPRSDPESLTLRLLSTLNAFIASSKINIKHESMWSFATLYTYACNNSYSTITCNPAFNTMFHFFQGLEKYKNPPKSRIHEDFDISRDGNLACLFNGGYLRIEPAEVTLVRIEDFERLEPKNSLGAGRLPLGATPNGGIIGHPDTTLSPRPAPTAVELPVTNKSTPLQTKALHLNQNLAPVTTSLADLSLDKLYSNGNGPILIGSLLEIPHNLGGLSRVAEIFACESLHIPSLVLLKNPQFKNVSVNSETHITVHETPLSALVSLLRLKKSEGYKIVGVEQTDESVVLGNDAGGRGRDMMTEKCVVIMGAERTGIPADVLVECDGCVEIRQWGVTRSLNVQTAAAVVLYEWRRIWRDGGQDVRNTMEREALVSDVAAGARAP
ncbi:hypothetical protein EJ08DRAFT_395630 [Tothia fuscella]|uniref:tRNA/rRNA methyltransferase SpoU type domain-containing protein n=1 Tax=Tothia fuscella TaxID=1048955 RepID=A0A9P4NLA6_9PEZI|nr:hypothetical protein EJ08DRAFT_395630 [Tothia fuscella]